MFSDVCLRNLCDGDVDVLVEMRNDPVSKRWTPIALNFDVLQAEKFVNTVYPVSYEDGMLYLFVIADVGSGRFLGLLNLFVNGAGVAEIGVNVVSSMHGRGVARRGVALLLDYAFLQLGVVLVNWVCAVGHWASRRVAWWCGFSFEATLRGFIDQRGVALDAWVLALAKDEPRFCNELWVLDQFVVEQELCVGSPVVGLPVVGGDGLFGVVDKVPSFDDGVVRLRGLCDLDKDDLVLLCVDLESVRWTTVPLDYGEDDALFYINSVVRQGFLSGKSHVFGVVDVVSDRLLGTVEVRAKGCGVGEVGINMSAAVRGCGVSERVVALLVDYAFVDLGLHTLRWVCAVDNWASRKLAYKCGFVFDGMVRKFFRQRGVALDAWVLSLCVS